MVRPDPVSNSSSEGGSPPVPVCSASMAASRLEAAVSYQWAAMSALPVAVASSPRSTRMLTAPTLPYSSAATSQCPVAAATSPSHRRPMRSSLPRPRAASSLLAAIDAEQTGTGGLPPSEELFDTGSGRTILLLRIGRGLLRSGRAEAAVPVLERAESQMRADPPGIRDQQTVRFALAEALARTLPADPTAARGRKARVGTLVDRAVEAEETGWARLQEAKVRLLAGQRALALRALRASLRLDPRSVEARLTLGGLLEGDGLLSLARDQYAGGLEALPGDPQLISAWAKASYATMDPDRALPRLREAAETATRDPFVFVARCCLGCLS